MFKKMIDAKAVYPYIDIMQLIYSFFVVWITRKMGDSHNLIEKLRELFLTYLTIPL